MSITIQVRNGNVEQALRVMKKKLQKNGVLKELKARQYFEKPSEKKRRKKKEVLLTTRKRRLNQPELEVINEFHAAFCCIYIMVRLFVSPDGVKTR